MHVSDGWSQERPAAQPVDSEQGAPAMVPAICMEAAGEVETSAATSTADAATRSDTIVKTKRGGRGRQREGEGRTQVKAKADVDGCRWQGDEGVTALERC